MVTSTIMIGERKTSQIKAKLANKIDPSFWRRWDSGTASLVLVCTISNLVAFVASSNLTPKYIELDSLVQPGHLLSLARTEGMILLATISLRVLVRSNLQRVALQGLVAGFLTADAVNDIILVTNGSWFLATELAYVTAASIPAMAVLMASESLLRHEVPGAHEAHKQGGAQLIDLDNQFQHCDDDKTWEVQSRWLHTASTAGLGGCVSGRPDRDVETRQISKLSNDPKLMPDMHQNPSSASRNEPSAGNEAPLAILAQPLEGLVSPQRVPFVYDEEHL